MQCPISINCRKIPIKFYINGEHLFALVLMVSVNDYYIMIKQRQNIGDFSTHMVDFCSHGHILLLEFVPYMTL